MIPKKSTSKVFTLRISDTHREILSKAAQQSNRPLGNYLVTAALAMAAKAA
jgi:uncharacterized protein (DUF1778 family)